ncbi:MAG: hypothetical protein Q8M97_01985 [Methanobacteriaceae archaeon]|nr:hypothetical protein [Methanobacteriaceae archaeon]
MKLENRLIVIILSVILIFIITTTISFYIFPNYNQNNTSFSVAESNNLLLSNNDYGSVVKMGPYGNSSSKVKIAYIIGVHPLESKSHQAISESILSQKSLKYCYYIYKINVTAAANNYNDGRMNGQLLAEKYAIPDIISNKFNLAIDIHSNVGNWEENRFIFSPVKGGDSESIALMIKNKISWLKYYVSPNPTSTKFVTSPLIQSNVPAIIYETYKYEQYDTTRNHADEFVSVIDNLNF